MLQWGTHLQLQTLQFPSKLFPIPLSTKTLKITLSTLTNNSVEKHAELYKDSQISLQGTNKEFK